MGVEDIAVSEIRTQAANYINFSWKICPGANDKAGMSRP